MPGSTVRFLLEMMPAVTVLARPKGSPMARTQSPTSTPSELPILTMGSGGVGLDFEDGNVGGLVDADDFGGTALVAFRIAGEADEDPVGFVDDVVVGDDVAARIDDEAGAEGLAFLAVIATAEIGILAEEAVEEVLEAALALPLSIALTLAVAVALRALIVIVAVVAVGRLLLLGEGHEVGIIAAAVLLLLFGENFSIDVDDGGAYFFGDAGEVGRELTGGGNFEGGGIGAVDL